LPQPNLTIRRLYNDLLEYSWQDIFSCLPARLNQHVQLQLSGWSTLMFDPAILSSTPRLTKLSIDILCDLIATFKGFIPPVEELSDPTACRQDKYH
jgi:hypothetical protein